MSKKYASNKEMLEGNGWKEIERGVYIPREHTSVKQVADTSVKGDYWKNQFREFKAGKVAEREKNGGQR